jgi:hypothetical protein
VCTAPDCGKTYPVTVAASTVRSHVLSVHGATTCIRRQLPRSAGQTLVAERLRKRKSRAEAQGLCLASGDGVQRCAASLGSSPTKKCKRTRLARSGWRCPDHPRLALADAEVRGVHGARASSRIVHVGPSLFFRRGVIADARLRPGDYLTEFACVESRSTKMRNPAYRLKLPGLEVMWGLPDPAPRCGVASLVNSAKGTGHPQNACFFRVPRTRRVFLKALADIFPGQEVFASYGSGFRLVA